MGNPTLYCLCVVYYLCSVTINSQPSPTFSNPIMDQISPDPQILFHDNFYYMILAIEERDMVIFKSPILTDFRNAESRVVYHPNSSYDACWAPELHMIDEQVYAYFSMHKTDENDHRMWVTKADDVTNLMGTWSDPVQLMQDEAEDANDGTFFLHPVTKQKYYVWTSLRPGTHPSSMYIAPMHDAYTVLYPRVLLRVPQERDWDCLDACLNEGAFVLVGPTNISHLIFSGSGSGSIHYSLGIMSIPGDLDPLNRENWSAATGRVFHADDQEDVYGPGHAAFTTSPDGSETWMSYHAQRECIPNNRQRIAYLEKIEWDSEGYPIFPKPHGHRSVQIIPSGQISP